MGWLAIVFWLSAGLIVYAYWGYGLLAMTLALFRKRLPEPRPITPNVTLLIAAYNEEDVLAAKLKNALSLDYPLDRLEILVVADGSTDRTVSIAQSYAACGIRLEFLPERRGKIHALNRIIPHLNSEIVVLSDANSMLNPESLRMLVRHFDDVRVACVAGEKRIVPESGEVSSGEGLYWRYESFLKGLDSRLGAVMGAAGEVMAIRRTCFEPLEPDTLLDDFVMSMRLVDRGYRVVYEKEAFSLEAASSSLDEELERKARIVAGGWQAIARLSGLLWPSRPLLTLQFVSHRVLRWVLVPYLFLLAFLCNLLLAFGGQVFYIQLLGGQVFFYLVALVGGLTRVRGLVFAPFYLVFVNFAAIVGGVRFWRHRQPVVWKKAHRPRAI